MNNNIKDYFKEIPNYLSFLILPGITIILSPILIEIGKTFNTNTGNITLIFTLYSLGNIAGIISSFYYRKKFSNILIIIISYSLLAFLIILLLCINILIIFFIIYFFIGYFSGNALIVATDFLLEGPVANKERLYTIATGFFILGSITFPIISSSIVKNGHSWKNIYYLLLLLVVITITSYLTITRKQKYLFFEKPQLIFKGIFICKQKNIIFFFLLFSLLFYSMSEWTLSNWIPTYFRTENFISIQGASYIVSIFWVSMITGRVVVSALAGRVKLEYIILVMSFMGILSMIILLFFAKKTSIIYIFICLTGLGYSGIHPLIFSNGSTLYEKGRGSLATLLYLASGLGVTSYSYLTRIISKHSIFISVFMPVIFFLVIFSLFTALILYKQKIADKSKNNSGFCGNLK